MKERIREGTGRLEPVAPIAPCKHRGTVYDEAQGAMCCRKCGDWVLGHEGDAARPLPQTDSPLHDARLYLQEALAALDRKAIALARIRVEKAVRRLDEAIAAGGR